ncbi:chromate transporter [Vogesella sp. LIG4]|uniref:chromate transporter n=1 Tax=Vogesella sp. LIG4 TaxID=1192162 RepID=UPI00082018F0|nr:chromate transporter [Vogesella sp. LIG4]SCK06464.1 chromate transporter [Vogesella sp. LIG4]
MMLWTLFALFAQYSLLAVGGAISVLPEIHRVVVGELGWMSGAQFAALFAIAQAAPGPNVLFVSLIGWQVAGVAGAAVSLLGICLPSSLLSFFVMRGWQRIQGSRLARAIESGLAPLTAGLLLAGGTSMLRALAPVHGGVWLCAASALLAWRLRINPLWTLAAGGLMGMLGWV